MHDNQCIGCMKNWRLTRKRISLGSTQQELRELVRIYSLATAVKAGVRCWCHCRQKPNLVSRVLPPIFSFFRQSLSMHMSMSASTSSYEWPQMTYIDCSMVYFLCSFFFQLKRESRLTHWQNCLIFFSLFF